MAEAEVKIKGVRGKPTPTKSKNKKSKKVIPIKKGNKEQSKKKKPFSLKNKLQRKGKEKTEKTNKPENKQARVLRQTPSLLPFLQNHDTYIMKKEDVMEIYQIDTKDLYTRNVDDLNQLISGLAVFFRSYLESVKFIGMNFPCNTESQRVYWEKKLSKAKDQVRIRFIERKLFELDYLEKERTNREYFLFIYADNEQQLEDRKKMAIRMMNMSFPLKELSKEKKEDVLFILNNQNTKL